MASAEQPKQRRNWWIWVSGALGVVTIGLLIWALTMRSDLDSTQTELDSATQQLSSTNEELDATKKDVQQLESAAQDDKRRGVAGAALTAGGLAAAKAAYDELADQLGATEQELATANEDIEAANKAADEAADDAKAAKQDAAQADDAVAEAEAEAAQAQAEVRAAESKRTVVTACARAYVSAFGGLFDGDDVSSQAAGVRKEFAAITDDCRAALAGT